MKGKEQHNTGGTSELFVAYKLSSKGFKVYFPFMTQSKADIVVEDPLGNFIKIQVKTATKSSGFMNSLIVYTISIHIFSKLGGTSIRLDTM